MNINNQETRHKTRKQINIQSSIRLFYAHEERCIISSIMDTLCSLTIGDIEAERQGCKTKKVGVQ